jgi:hypothetical protein
MFGPGLPEIRAWTERRSDFAGIVTGFDPTALADGDAPRADLGYRPDERICLVTVGGSGVGGHVLERGFRTCYDVLAPCRARAQ